MTFAERLRATRKALNLTQEHVAAKLGVTPTTYSRYENGKREPNVECLKKLSNIFNVSADFLINTNLYNKDAVLNETEKKLLSMFREMNSQGQEYILQTADMARDKYIKTDNISVMENAE